MCKEIDHENVNSISSGYKEERLYFNILFLIKLSFFLCIHTHTIMTDIFTTIFVERSMHLTFAAMLTVLFILTVLLGTGDSGKILSKIGCRP